MVSEQTVFGERDPELMGQPCFSSTGQSKVKNVFYRLVWPGKGGKLVFHSRIFTKNNWPENVFFVANKLTEKYPAQLLQF